MKVLQHDHSLYLIDLNPNHPHDEAVYDDEEDLVIKQAFQSSCGRCQQEITYYHKYYYKCDQCNYSLHKLCGEFPVELQHASHSAHALTLFLDESQGECHMCNSTSQYNKLRYHCSRCMFNICLDCAMDVMQYHPIYHPNHQHPMIPICRRMHILTQCDACGEKHNGIFYECSTCFRFLIHNDCVFQPKRLLIQDVTNGRFFHTHPLILTYSFLRVQQKAKFDPTCRLCDNSFSHNENLWLYMCEKCRYYVNLKCIYLRWEPSYSDRIKLSESNEPVTNILRPPFLDQIYTEFTRLSDMETNAKSITHHSHPHPLVLVDKMAKVQDLCDGCLRPVMDMSFYKCTNDCAFVLHDLCTRLPRILQGHTGESRHTLRLMQEANRPNAFCRVCNHFCNGFFYICDDCHYPPPFEDCNYTVDVSCALMIETITHKSHPYHLLSKVEKRSRKDYCRMCLSGFRSKEESSFSCDVCNFHIHPECAFSLPETIRHKYDKHPMTLTYSPVENHEGDYFYEVCEEELNPYISFYHCHQCVQSIHSGCARLKPLPKSYILYDGFCEEGGSRSKTTYPNKYHNHPLSFVKETPSYKGRCSECHLSLRDDFIFKCLQCDYEMHAYHLNERAGYESKIIHEGTEYPFHRHELSLRPRNLLLRYLPPCQECTLPFPLTGDYIYDDYIYHCDLCYASPYAIHAYHKERKCSTEYHSEIYSNTYPFHERYAGHTLQFRPATSSEHNCRKCRLSLNGYNIFKCVKCEDYAIHAYHTPMRDTTSSSSASPR